MLFSKMEKANKVERSDTAAATSSSSVNRYEILSPNTKHKTKKTTPSAIDIPRMTLMANFAAFASPFPNSFDTRTLIKNETENQFWSYIQGRMTCNDNKFTKKNAN